ncbi:MAG TPA: CHAP domain-containing protein [Intrasporangium sp.]|uniref:CHAP domain-containing protein n=1 Tax=Intrasporangium sp. TaxID=1925024 RepID=UPI002D77B63C|nr:CHAP domain-containing protein [Intrasporangium sp.]HET7397303.1 CHAP domain-containing protein [Intrasporangium sp.]
MAAPCSASPRSSAIRTVLVALALFTAGLLPTAGAARATEWVVLCTGYDACAASGYPNAGYKDNSATSYWSQWAGHNCTNYVAYRLVRNGMPNTRPASLTGNAFNWGPSFPSQTNDDPAVGSVAWWDTSFSSTGHVAYVERVVSADEIVISEDNWGGDFRWRKVTRTGGRWPNGFIHLRDQSLTVADPDVYRPVTPTRLLDTRTGLGAPAAKVAAGTSVALQVTGRSGIPTAGVGTVLLNLTVTAPATAGYLSSYPSGATRPASRSLSYPSGATLSELVPARVGTDGRVRLYTSASAHLLAEVVGWYPTTGHLVPVTPTRVLDTSTGLGTTRVRIPAGGSLDLPVAGAGIVPGTGASAVALDLTALAPSAAGWLTAYPTGTARPVTAHVFYDSATAKTGMVVSRLGTGGKVTIQSTAQTDLMVDVVGWFRTGGDHVAVTPARLLDNRSGLGAPTGPLAAGGTVTVPVLGRGGVPTAGVRAVSVTVTPISPAATAAVTAYAGGTARPSTPTLWVAPGRTGVNAAIVPVGADGSITLHTTAGSYLVVDVQGYLKK